LSNIAMAGGATGTGTVTLLAPVTSTDRTLTLPDATGTVLTTATAGVPVNGPAFSAYPSGATTITGSVFTKVTFDTKEYDTATCFDTTLNRFTPNVAGYYLITSTVSFSNVATYFTNLIYKNGSVYRQGVELYGGVLNFFTTSVTTVMYLNGTTDYVEIYGTAGSTAATVNTGNSIYNYFEGCLIRSAV